MYNLPEWVQFFIVLIFADFAPLAFMVLIANIKFFYSLRTAILIVGTIFIKYLNNVMPVTEHVKDLAAHVYLVLTIVFIVLAIKNKWLWDRNLFEESK